jgi:ABC-type lipoprotein export system ATPase subunit
MSLFKSKPQESIVDLDAPAPGTLISVRNLEKSYAHGTSRTFVLRRVSLDVKDGEFVSIMGPSGAGKSTLMKLLIRDELASRGQVILGMHDSAWTGEYYFLGQPVHRLGAKERAQLHKQHIGFVFQSYHLLDHLTVYENLEIPLSYRDVRKSERESVVCDVLDRFAIVGKKDLYPNQLSGGQQQLVAVARAVISNPKVILADEPTGNLHSSQGREIMELFRKLNDEGTTIIQVTHSETNAGYGHRIIQLRDGWVVGEEGEAKAV